MSGNPVPPQELDNEDILIGVLSHQLLNWTRLDLRQPDRSPLYNLPPANQQLLILLIQQ